jgi:hypothetical protein
MKKEIKFSLKDLRFMYYRYKDSPYFLLLIIVIVFFSSTFLFFYLVVPKIQDWFSIRDEVERTSNRIDVINNNISFLQGIDKIQLENQVDTATSALPVEKNFGTIVTALSDSAINAGVTMDDYTFQVGKVASVEGQLNVFGQKELSLVKVSVMLTGNFQGITLFLKEIQNKLPLAEVTEVDGDTLSTKITVQFYQKKFPKIIFKDSVAIAGFSHAQLALLEELSAWQPFVPQEEIVSSESGESVPLF